MRIPMAIVLVVGFLGIALYIEVNQLIQEDLNLFGFPLPTLSRPNTLLTLPDSTSSTSDDATIEVLKGSNLSSSESLREVFMPMYYKNIKLDLPILCSEKAVPNKALEDEARERRELCKNGNYTELVRRHYSLLPYLPLAQYLNMSAPLSDKANSKVWSFRSALTKAQLCPSSCDDSRVYEFNQGTNPGRWRGIGARLAHMIAGFGCTLKEENTSFVIVDGRRDSRSSWAFTSGTACQSRGHSCYFRQPFDCPVKRSKESRKDVTLQRGMCHFNQMHPGLDRMRASTELTFFLMQPNPKMLGELVRIKKMLNWEKIPKPILSMHVRHGKTKHEAYYIRFERFMQAAETMRDMHGKPFKSIFLFSDDKFVLDMAANEERYKKRWTMVSIDAPKFEQRGWDERKVRKGADAFLSVISHASKSCETAGLTLVNILLASMSGGFLGMFNSNLDRVIARLFQAQVPNSKGKSPPLASLDAWPCGFSDVVCAPQVRGEFPLAVLLDAGAESKDLRKSTKEENNEWWKNNAKNFTAEWARRAGSRRRKIEKNKFFSGIFGGDWGEGEARRLAYEKAMQDISSCRESKHSVHVATPILDSGTHAPHRIGQILEAWIDADILLPCVTLEEKFSHHLQFSPPQKGLKLLSFQPGGKNRDSKGDIEIPTHVLPEKKSYFQKLSAPKEAEIGVLARQLFSPTDLLISLMMECLDISRWPWYADDQPIVGLSLPTGVAKEGVSDEVYAHALATVCQQTGAKYAFVAKVESFPSVQWEATFRKRLDPIGVTLVTFSAFRLWSGIHEWRHSPKLPVYAMFHALSMVDIFVGNPLYPSDRLLYHLINSREAQGGRGKPLALEVNCDGIRRFDGLTAGKPWRATRFSGCS
ncbi:hypothetical protein AAMO2058_000957300 [Amorphochlora amoebiformis]